MVSVRVLISVKFNYMYFMTSLRGKNEVQVKFEKSMHNYNVTFKSHWHHTLVCQCSSFGTYAVHKVVPITEYWSLKNWTILWHRYEVKMRLRLNLKTACTNTMPPSYINMTHWDVSAVVFVLMLFTKWYPSDYWSLKSWTSLWPHYEVKMRSRLNLKTACTTTMPPEFIDIIYWGVSAVGSLVHMLFTKWYPSKYWSLENVTIYYVATRYKWGRG